MTTNRKPSASLTKIIRNLDEDKLRRTRDRMLIATKIADTLKAKGITQREFSRMIRKSESEISEWLSGDRNFTIDTLSDISKCIGVNLLNISYIRTSTISNDASKRKIKKERNLSNYDDFETLTISISSSWQSVAPCDMLYAL